MFVYISNNRLLEISDRVLEFPIVPFAPANKYQIWDGHDWVGSPRGLRDRYGNFRVEMLASVGWNRAKMMTANVPEFMGAIAYMDENPSMVKFLWNLMIVRLPTGEKATAEEIAEWNAIASSTEISFYWLQDRSISFDFSDEGLMI